MLLILPAYLALNGPINNMLAMCWHDIASSGRTSTSTHHLATLLLAFFLFVFSVINLICF